MLVTKDFFEVREQCLQSRLILWGCYVLCWGGCPVWSALVRHQHAVQHNTCQNNVSNNLWTLLYCVQQDPESACQDSKNILHNPPASGDPAVCYCLIPCELSSAVGFYTPLHQGKVIITQQEMWQIWSSLPKEFRWRKPQSGILDVFRELVAVKYLCIR